MGTTEADGAGYHACISERVMFQKASVFAIIAALLGMAALAISAGLSAITFGGIGHFEFGFLAAILMLLLALLLWAVGRTR